MAAYRIHVEKDYTSFAAAHFVTYDGHKCEPLHGHNYRAAVGMLGDLDEEAYVFNFVPLKHALREIVNRLDHRVLLAEHNPLLDVRVDDEAVEVTYTVEPRRYVFPRADVVLLPIRNTTAEMLAAWICGQLRQSLSTFETGNIHAVEIEIEETFGQRAIYREEWK